MNVLRKTVIIYIILLIDKLAQHESNVLRLCLVIYPVQESGTGQGYTVIILFVSSADTEKHLLDHQRFSTCLQSE